MLSVADLVPEVRPFVIFVCQCNLGQGVRYYCVVGKGDGSFLHIRAKVSFMQPTKGKICGIFSRGLRTLGLPYLTNPIATTPSFHHHLHSIISSIIPLLGWRPSLLGCSFCRDADEDVDSCRPC